MDACSIGCTVIVEELSTTGIVQKKTQHKNIILSLGRDQFREIVLKLELSKKEVKYNIKELVVHKKFIKDGKATIKLPDSRIQFMISNCPPDKLVMFVKTLLTKLECLKQKGFVSLKKRLLSEERKGFQEISPLTMKDLQEAHHIKQKELDASRPSEMNSKKRKRPEEDITGKENGNVAKRPAVSAPGAIVAAPVTLSKEQTMVLNMVMQGRNIFFTGSAGTGKSFLLKRIIGALPPHHTFATASTGVAACHIGGTTLHSFAGMGSGKAPLEQCIELASRKVVVQQWRKCRHLIIDEISMVDGDFFDKLETVARVVKQCDKPFGGIQLIVCGDFLQLPPVTKESEKRKFAFQSKSWHNVMHVNLELKEVRRQSDRQFIDILQNVRYGRCPEFVYSKLKATSQNQIHKHGILATKLCTHKDDVEQINRYHIDKLTGDKKKFVGTDTDNVYTKQLNTLCPVPDVLELKQGAQVMLAKNLDVQRGLVNGARGIIIGFNKGPEGLPIVQFACGVEEVIKPIRWVVKVSGGVILTRKQIPLKLAWAISIHKSQGMTLDCVEISLSRVFEAGQAYVALSRAKSLEGLRCVDFEKSCVRANSDVLRFYHKLQLHQKMMQTSVDAYSGETKLVQIC